MSSLAALRNTARSAVVNAAMRMAPRVAAGASRQAAPALWARSFASGGFLPKEEVSSRVLDVVKNFQNVDPAKVTATSHFINDLGLDSLDTVEVRSPRPPDVLPARDSPQPTTVPRPGHAHTAGDDCIARPVQPCRLVELPGTGQWSSAVSPRQSSPGHGAKVSMIGMGQQGPEQYGEDCELQPCGINFARCDSVFLL